VLDTRELGHRPGTLRSLTRVVAAPAELGIDMIGVPEGTDLELELRLEAVVEGVLVSGTVRGVARGECVRCLEAVEVEFEAELQELYAYPERRLDLPEDADDEVRELQDEMVDLQDAVRDAVVPALPQRPLCEQDCPGLCPQCGMRLADDPDHRHGVVDPRWQALESLDITE
jgi:uncharacterized protein